MPVKKKTRRSASALEQIPGVGPSIAADLEDIGISSVAELKGADPQALYFGAGCAGCHGLHGAGGTVAPPVWTMELSKVTKMLRDGGHGMPVFAPQRLSDEQVSALVDYLHGLRKQYPDEQERKPARPGTAGTP